MSWDTFLKCFTIEPDGDIPDIPPMGLRYNKEELAIDGEMVKKT